MNCSVRKHGTPPFRVAVIHGGPGAPGCAAPLARALSSDIGVLEPIQSADSLEGQVQELRAQLEAEAELPAVLVGHSWGAWLGYLVAARHPEMVSKLILVCSGGFQKEDGSRTLQTRLDRVSEADRTEALALLANHATWTPRLGDILAQSDVWDPMPPDGESEPVVFQQQLHEKVWGEAKQLRESGELIEIGKKIKCPVVAIHGDYDPHPADGVERPLSAILPDFRFILLKNCGHEPWSERQARQEFLEIMGREIGSGTRSLMHPD